MVPNIGGKQIRKYTEPTLQCNCGCEFFEKFIVNKFKTTATDLSNGQKDMDSAHRVTLLRCLACGESKLPVLSYNYMSPVDREIANELVDVLEKAKKNETNLPTR